MLTEEEIAKIAEVFAEAGHLLIAQAIHVARGAECQGVEAKELLANELNAFAKRAVEGIKRSRKASLS